jgi:hypothetical protein
VLRFQTLGAMRVGTCGRPVAVDFLLQAGGSRVDIQSRDAEERCGPPHPGSVFRMVAAKLGRNRALGLVGGRCSAAQVGGFRRFCEKKLFKRCCEKCEHFLPEVPNDEPHGFFRLWDEFGTTYFEFS